MVGLLGLGAFALAGSAAAKTQPVMLAWSPSPYDFGSATVNRQTPSQTFTLTNSGGSASSALKVTLPGSGAFSITSDTCSAISVGPGKSCQVVVQFAPTSTGLGQAMLSVASSKPAASATDSFSGTGASAGHLYWANSGNGAIVKAGLDGTNPQTIAFGFPSDVAVGSGHVYWTNANGGTIVEAGLDGTNPQTILTSRGPSGVAGDSSHLYWANGFDGTIVEANLDGTNPQTIVTGEIQPSGVAVDSSHLYWTNQRDGTIVEAGLDGTNPQTIATGQSIPFGVAVGP